MRSFLTLIFILFLAGCATHKMMVIDTSYMEGCETGAYSLAASAQIQLNPITVSAACQQLYLERLKILNPKYKQIDIKDQGLQSI